MHVYMHVSIKITQSPVVP